MSRAVYAMRPGWTAVSAPATRARVVVVANRASLWTSTAVSAPMTAFATGEGWRPWVFGLTAMLGAAVTAFYMSRLFFMTFYGEKRWEKGVHPHESPLTMTVPMMVLAVGSALLGFVLSFNSMFVHWLAPIVG